MQRHLTVVQGASEAPARPPKPAGRQFTVHARAERNGIVLCHATMVVVQGLPGRLGLEPRDDLTAWFYGAMTRDFEEELEVLAGAARQYAREPELLAIDLTGPLELRGCTLRPPVRHAGPANTLQYRLSHAGALSAGRPQLRVVA